MGSLIVHGVKHVATHRTLSRTFLGEVFGPINTVLAEWELFYTIKRSIQAPSAKKAAKTVIVVLMAKCCNHCSAQSLFATVTIVPHFFLSFFFLDQRKVYSKSLVQGALTWSI